MMLSYRQRAFGIRDRTGGQTGKQADSLREGCGGEQAPGRGRMGR